MERKMPCLVKTCNIYVRQILLTLFWKAELIANDACIKGIPAVITHRSPVVIDANLHSSLTAVCSTHKPNLSRVADITRDIGFWEWNKNVEHIVRLL